MAQQTMISSMMAERRVFKPPKELAQQAFIKSLDEYKKIHKRSIEEPEGFWAEMAEQLDWYKKWDKVLVADFANAKHEWFIGGKLNVSYNCLDRHLETWRKNKAALIWEGDIGDSKTLTYQEVHYHVCKFANVLKKHGVRKGDRVTIYLPMIPELPIAMLACARIGAIHSVVFGGFSADALRDRMIDCESTVLICADGYYRGGKVIRSKDNADQALESCPKVKDVIVVKRANIDVPMKAGRDYWWNVEMAPEDIKAVCEPEKMDSDDPLFILYTSGSTGKPKGVLHTTAGYLLYVYQTYKWIFDVKEEDTFWCTADIGWVTGHSYIVYGPLSYGATSLMFEGIPTYPHPDRFWDIVEKYRVNIFYTAPTALRALMREGEEWPNKHDLSSLRILGSVGEPINPEAWMWYYNVIGKSKCPIVDTWWQTETGGALISPLPGAIPLKPGSATVPFPGIELAILREDGTPANANEGGHLVIKKPWPGLMRRVYGDPARFKNTYFLKFPGVYTSGDGARMDEDGYYWLMGRIDDVINVSGHRIGTAEVESALVSHEKVAEAAVVGMPHDIKGQGIYAFVTLKAGVENSEALKKELIAHVRKEIGPIATPDEIQFADNLPKTRSGKIMRRILTKIAAGDITNLGDTTTLADPSVVDMLVSGRKK
ncbi:MAG: acetate--CoA ligase [Chloroflexi bacterium]|nr:acetate--CoA ligase [Chloroflexota bacterium]MBM3154065.1 acetate--CoA ligase [Chloroflexota bacterium]MBM3173280.1 acetate--CoA ligase [Chloroflexota bacterium]MBM3174266.1 acetate--CoA ligase [Chloroflexota bacterium]MBM4449517.1 acetate--CoA ligase [Chloroflexota bacterium]